MQRPLHTALTYLLVAITWILVSDRVIEWLVPGTTGVATLQSIKGLGFVLVTSLLLWGLLSRDHAAQRQSAAERERLVAQLEAERSQLNVVLENMGDAVLLVDEHQRITVANPAASALLGIPLDRLLGLDVPRQPWQLFDELGHPIPMSERPLARALHGEGTTLTYRIVFGSEERWISETAAPVRDAQGHIRGAVLVGRDITEVRRQQEQLAQGDKLRALGQLAGGVAHDLNQSLALIMGYGELLHESLERGVDDREGLSRMAQMIAEAAHAGGNTVGRLLTFARGRPPAAFEPVDVALLLQEVATLTAPRWQRAAQAEGRTIGVVLDVEGSPVVEGSAASLRECLTNLIFNAIDAMPEGGTIKLVARTVGDQVELRVADTGVGMPADVRARIFEPFFTTKGERGTGLGLPMVHGVVGEHRGEITADSEIGRGTTFTLRLPVAQGGALTGAPPASADDAAGKDAPRTLKALVTDDEPTLARMLATMLERLGHQARVTFSGEEALDRLRDEPFDVLISDVTMGAGMNGWELAARARELYPTMPVMLATGWAAQIAPTAAEAHGVVAVIAKPSRMAHLRQVLATLTEPGRPGE